MFGVALYAMLCLAGALVVVSVWNLFRPVADAGERSTAPRLLLCWIFFIALPYLAVEAQSALYGKRLENSVVEAVSQKWIEGDLVYYKVQHIFRGQAQLIVVTNVTSSWWSGTYRNIYKLRAKRYGSRWHVVSVDPIDTMESPAHVFTFPPYW
ncbi:MAG: hypothetical protein QXI19_15005 [Candidatus Caldarchaeum sp.]